MARSASVRGRGFSLIEVLVVVTVILVLMGLLIPATGLISDRYREGVTVERMQSVLMAMTRLGETSKSVTYGLQEAVPGYGGTLRFVRPAGADGVRPAPAVPGGPWPAWHPTYPRPEATAKGNPLLVQDPGAPLVMAYPWGQPRSYLILEDWYRVPLALAAGSPSQWTAAERAAWERPERHRLHELWPEYAAELLVAIGIAPDADTVRSDRDPGQPWNDAYGNPLVLAVALYQPPEASVPPGPADAYLSAAKRAYGFNRACYLSVGTLGPTPLRTWSPDPSGFSAALRVTWDAVVGGSALVWDERSWEQPPWQGVHIYRQRQRRHFLAAPQSFR